jgi:hypothetical protein
MHSLAPSSKHIKKFSKHAHQSPRAQRGFEKKPLCGTDVVSSPEETQLATAHAATLQDEPKQMLQQGASSANACSSDSVCERLGVCTVARHDACDGEPTKQLPALCNNAAVENRNSIEIKSEEKVANLDDTQTVQHGVLLYEQSLNNRDGTELRQVFFDAAQQEFILKDVQVDASGDQTSTKVVVDDAGIKSKDIISVPATALMQNEATSVISSAVDAAKKSDAPEPDDSSCCASIHIDTNLPSSSQMVENEKETSILADVAACAIAFETAALSPIVIEPDESEVKCDAGKQLIKEITTAVSKQKIQAKSLKLLSISELKEVCVALGIDTTGTRAVVQKRILNFAPE